MRWPFKLVAIRSNLWVLLAVSALVGVLLFAVGFGLSIVKPPVIKGENPYSDLSSFLGVMLPLNLIGNLSGFKRWLSERLAYCRDQYVVHSACVPRDGFAECFSKLVDVAVEPYTQVRDENDQLLLRWSNRVGFGVAILITVLFVTGIYPELRPYAILVAWPLLSYALLTAWNGWSWNKSFAYVCEHMEASPVDPTEFSPIDDEGEIANVKEVLQ